MRLRRSIAVLGLLSLSASLHAQQPDVREQFRVAYAAVESGATEVRESNELRAYMLYPYLRQLRLQRALAAGDVDNDIAEFLQTYGTQPATRELRRVWYADLAKRQQWRTYLDHYRPVDDATLRCHALTARLRERRDAALLVDSAALWRGAADSLQACEPAFTYLKENGALTKELIEDRARLALRAGNPAFARQLIVMLPHDSHPPLLAWARLIEVPRAAIDAAIAQPANAIEADALMDGWTRLVRADATAAMQRLTPLIQARTLDAATQSRFAMELALSLSWSRRPEALQYFAKVRREELDERGHEWHARAAIWAGNWALARRVIDAMPESLRSQTRWRYWSARSMEMLDDKDGARAQYQQLLVDDNFHAALSAARLKVGYTPRQIKLTFDGQQTQRLSMQPEFVRARELLAMPNRTLRAQAYEEWRQLYSTLSVDERRNAIALAAGWQWHDQVIALAAQLGHFDDYELFYPRPFDAFVDEAAKRTQLPGPLIYATLRQESLYRTDALSPADARGVMQLLPESATRVARRWQLPLNIANGDLFDPKISIPIGAAKLREHRDRFGHVALALCAYNAGPNTVPRWLPTRSTDVDVWIENIPYNETRTYVQRVHWHSLVFAWRENGKPQDVSSWLAPIPSR